MIYRSPRRRRITPAALVCLVLHPFAQGFAGPTQPVDSNLDPLLERLARVASLFHDSTLRFTCEETISYSGVWSGNDTVKFNYFYVRDATNGLRNFRTWHGRPRRGNAPREVSPKEYRVPVYVENAYFWVFVFEPSRRGLHRYRILGEDTVFGRPAVRVQFEPIPPFTESNNWYGTAWVDRADSQLLRVEALRPESYEEQLRFQRDLAQPQIPDETYGESYDIQRVSTEFTVVKNGMRFPGRVEIRDLRYKIVGESRHRERLLFRVEQKYRDYLFFGVRTEEEIKGILAGR